jgi:hypothetical protein
LCGDYVVQSDWMAQSKTSAHLPAAAHAISYAACFLPITRNPKALAVIGLSHFVIDRWRLARYVCWLKNQASPKAWRYPWGQGRKTGYLDERPAWMTVWLMIIADNTAHLAINHCALARWPAAASRPEGESL